MLLFRVFYRGFDYTSWSLALEVLILLKIVVAEIHNKLQMTTTSTPVSSDFPAAYSKYLSQQRRIVRGEPDTSFVVIAKYSLNKRSAFAGCTFHGLSYPTGTPSALMKSVELVKRRQF
jgi:hypothetical protein